MGVIIRKSVHAVVISLAAAFVFPAYAVTRYVSPTGGQVAPYTSWATAARVIQDAVDAAVDGDEIVVTNGIYLTGGRMVPGTNVFGTNLLVSRVAVDSQIVVRSVNGPQFTVIDGQKNVRCVALASNAVLSGFTLTNGFAPKGGGGVYCELVTSVITNCTLAGNVASNSFGGGSYGGSLYNCTLTGNSSSFGGGACYGDLNGCIVSGNSANLGGGVYGGTRNSCAITKNSAQSGGGSYNGVLANCTLTGNLTSFGSSVYGAELRNSIVYYNTGPGGNYDSSTTLNYCCTTPLPPTGTNNLSAEPQLAGAWHLSASSPCIGNGSFDSAFGVDIDGEPWGNPPSVGCNEYWSGMATGALSIALAISYTNVATGFAVNFESAVNGLVSMSSLSFGDGVVVSNRPYASHPWAAPGEYAVVLRAYNKDFAGGVAVTGTVHVVAQPVHYVVASGSSPSAPYSSWASAANNIQGAVDATTVPGALVLVSNGVYQTGIRAVLSMSNRVAITKPVMVRSVNGPSVTRIVGYKVAGTTNGTSAVRCVYLTNGAVLSGFTLTNGATQASGDQYRQKSGGAVFCELGSAVVSNCVLTGNSAYSGGGAACFGALINCTLVGNTANSGGGIYSGALNKCILRGNLASYYGGGAYLGTLDNCTLTNNSAASSGGGVYSGTLNNCVLMGNSASAYAPYGGGTYISALNNCTVSSNTASGTWPYGGGAYSGLAKNSILYFNYATNGDNYFFPGPSAMNYCCTTPDPGGAGNITIAPLFTDFANGNLRILSNSPCVNSGNNILVSDPIDLDDNPRVSGGTVDMGAYEFQVPGSAFSMWLQQYGLPTDGSADYLDTDHDGINNWREWMAGTNPTNALSLLKIISATKTSNPAGTIVTWASQNSRQYHLQRSSALTQSAFSTIQDNIAGQAGVTSFADTNAIGPGPFFYRVGVKFP
jgi:parallel beta-helix repeat protein